MFPFLGMYFPKNGNSISLSINYKGVFYIGLIPQYRNIRNFPFH